jgi:two-component system, chemotaxis family, chemotaxis protein CheY
VVAVCWFAGRVSLRRQSSAVVVVTFTSLLFDKGHTLGNVWIVDDDHALRTMVQVALSQAGYQVQAAKHGGEALGLARAGQLSDLILLDWRMAPVSGRDFATAYRDLPGRKAPIIVLTANEDVVSAAVEIDAAGFLRKPFSLDELEDIVSRFTAPTDSGCTTLPLPSPAA